MKQDVALHIIYMLCHYNGQTFAVPGCKLLYGRKRLFVQIFNQYIQPGQGRPI